MQISKAQLTDLQQILELQKLCYIENAERYGDFQIAPIIQTILEIENDFKECVFLKVVEASQIVGSVRAYQKNGTCYIGRLIVRPNFQNKGIGKRLMEEVEIQFNTASRFELFTGFRDEKNLYFYGKLGYKQFKQVKIKEDLIMIYLEKIKNEWK